MCEVFTEIFAALLTACPTFYSTILRIFVFDSNGAFLIIKAKHIKRSLLARKGLGECVKCTIVHRTKQMSCSYLTQDIHHGS